MTELQMNTKYTGQEIIDWVAKNPKHPISIELTRKYYYIEPEWFEVKCLNPQRQYTIRSYTAYWNDGFGSITHTTFKIERVPVRQPRRSSLKKGI